MNAFFLWIRSKLPRWLAGKAVETAEAVHEVTVSNIAEAIADHLKGKIIEWMQYEVRCEVDLIVERFRAVLKEDATKLTGVYSAGKTGLINDISAVVRKELREQDAEWQADIHGAREATGKLIYGLNQALHEQQKLLADIDGDLRKLTSSVRCIRARKQCPAKKAKKKAKVRR